ncbi:hypothetical protein MIND_00297600 [Mycena indigotica]|uniref:Uncharacterized protein n=1 Tax=Mycena indigotica TaxID=2126181 RepID=A0A8H6WC14_9AGAR|nr:uncharacterized protein MIND_00297600 [Mycena indigotica]KAF7309273.1 hypothetical protein MIND_00297600 [Mycena indigotica]
MSHDAYESDTGDRDIPSVDNFLTNTPVERRIFPAKRKKALNRRGRAICRIAYAHDFPIAQIARIFGVAYPTVDHTLQEFRQYHLYDQPENDYYYAGEEWAKAFPRKEEEVEKERKRKLGKRQGEKISLSTGRRVGKRPRYSSPKSDPDDDEGDSSSASDGENDWDTDSGSSLSACERSDADENQDSIPDPPAIPKPPPSFVTPLEPDKPKRPTVKKPFMTGYPSPTPSFRETSAGTQAPTGGSSSQQSPKPKLIRRLPAVTHRPPATSANDGSTLTDFLSRITIPGTNLNTPAHIELFTLQGLTIDRLKVIARWPRDDLTKGLRRLLLRGPNDAAGTRLDVFEVAMLEHAVRKLAGSHEAKPFPLSNIHDSPSLQHFLHSVYALDLSAHLQLFVANAYTLERLRALSVAFAESSADELGSILESGLGRRRNAGASAGMAPLELLALEFALRSTSAGNIQS